MEGRIFSYIHFNGQVGTLVKVSTLTDFAARTDEFLSFGRDLAMHIAMTNPATISDLLKETFIKDEEMTIEILINEITDVLGEKVEIMGFTRYGIK